MARELLQSTVDFTYEHLSKYPYSSPSEIVGILSHKSDAEDGLKFMELRALVIKEMDRAKKRIKSEK